MKAKAGPVETAPVETPAAEVPAAAPEVGTSGICDTDNFEAVAAAVPAVIGDTAEAPGDLPPGAPGGQAEAGPVGNERLASFADAFADSSKVKHWVDVPFSIAARVLNDDTYKLEDYEQELFAEAAAALSAKYMPSLLARTDSPEWAMFGLAVTAYTVRVGGVKWLQKMKDKKSAATEKPAGQVFTPAAGGMGLGGLTAGSPAASGSAGNPGPGRVF